MFVFTVYISSSWLKKIIKHILTKDRPQTTMGFTFAQIASALIQGSRWKNAKRKGLISQVKYSLMANMSRRKAIIRQWHLDVDQLLRISLDDEAYSKVEQIYREQCIVSAYAQLYQFCDCIYSNLNTMSKCSSELSNDVLEAVSSLIYAASRCGDVPELHGMRNMLKQHFGQEFERSCVELRPGNNVYPQIKQYLKRKLVVPEDVKHQLMNDIVKELGTFHNSGQNLVPEFQGLRYNKTNTSITCYSSSSAHSAALPVQNEAAAIHHIKILSEKRRVGATLRKDLEPEEISVTKSHGLHNSSETVAETQKRAKDLKPCLSHVHPKLPDYDDLVVKFTDMKKKIYAEIFKQ